jgi:hypothetical protein
MQVPGTEPPTGPLRRTKVTNGAPPATGSRGASVPMAVTLREKSVSRPPDSTVPPVPSTSRTRTGSRSCWPGSPVTAVGHSRYRSRSRSPGRAVGEGMRLQNTSTGPGPAPPLVTLARMKRDPTENAGFGPEATKTWARAGRGQPATASARAAPQPHRDAIPMRRRMRTMQTRATRGHSEGGFAPLPNLPPQPDGAGKAGARTRWGRERFSDRLVAIIGRVVQVYLARRGELAARCYI